MAPCRPKTHGFRPKSRATRDVVVPLPHDGGVQHAARGVQGIHGGVDTEPGRRSTLLNSRSYHVGRHIVSRYMIICKDICSDNANSHMPYAVCHMISVTLLRHIHIGVIPGAIRTVYSPCQAARQSALTAPWWRPGARRSWRAPGR